MAITGNSEFWPRLVLAVLATWRITHLVAREDGPADLIARVRAALGDSLVGKLLDCFYCLSLWVAAPFALWVAGICLEAGVIWLAVSGAAILCERMGAPDVVVQPLPEANQGDRDGVLRTES